MPVIERVGWRLEPMVEALRGVLAMAGETLVGILVWPLRRRRWRMDRIAMELDGAFLGALPIVVLIGVSIVYEIGPLMTGIILAARSGSSNAAQLGSMVVSEELDALKQMGVQPLSYLVIPKILALAFTVLSLDLLFDCVAILGGAVFSYFVADIRSNAYLSRTSEALALTGFFVAAAKCTVFGWLAGVDNLILKLNQVFGITMVVVTHDLEFAELIADRALMLSDGDVLAFGDKRTVWSQPDQRVQDFLSRRAPLRTIE